MNVNDLEPADRDPKAMRRTALILVLIMFIGGGFIAYKYFKKREAEFEEIKKGRPAMLIELRKNFSVLNQDGEGIDFTSFEGKMTLVGCISLKSMEQSQPVLDALKAAAEHYKDNNKVHMVCISADHPDVVKPEELKKFMEEQNLNPEKWTFVCAASDTLSGYVKDQLKLGPIFRAEGKAPTFSGNVRLLDPGLRVRGEIDHFRFRFYTEVQERAKKEAEANPDLLKDEKIKFQYERQSNAVKERTEQMYSNIDYVLENEKDFEAMNEKRNSNIYKGPLLVAAAFLIFLLIMRYRLKKAEAAQ